MECHSLNDKVCNSLNPCQLELNTDNISPFSKQKQLEKSKFNITLLVPENTNDVIT